VRGHREDRSSRTPRSGTRTTCFRARARTSGAP